MTPPPECRILLVCGHVEAVETSIAVAIGRRAERREPLPRRECGTCGPLGMPGWRPPRIVGLEIVGHGRMGDRAALQAWSENYDPPLPAANP